MVLVYDLMIHDFIYYCFTFPIGSNSFNNSPESGVLYSEVFPLIDENIARKSPCLIISVNCEVSTGLRDKNI